MEESFTIFIFVTFASSKQWTGDFFVRVLQTVSCDISTSLSMNELKSNKVEKPPVI